MLALTTLLATVAAGRVESQAPVRTDRYGDPLPEFAVARFGTLRLRNAGPIAFTPDGKQIVAAGGTTGSQVVFWDAATGKERRRLPANGSILRLQFSPDGRKLAVMTGTVFANPVYDVAGGKILFTFKGEFGTFTRDGRYLLGVYHGNGAPTVGRWEAATGKLAGEWAMPAEAWSTCVSPDGKTVAYLLGESVILYDLEKQTPQQRWPGAKMRSLAFSPDGKRLAASSMAGVRLWDAPGGQEVFAWGRLVDSSVVFSADGKNLAWTGYDERSIGYPWVVAVGQAQPRRLGLPINNLGSHLAFAPDGRTLAVGTDASAVELRDVTTGRDALPFDANTGRIFGLELSPDGRYLAAADAYRVLVWDRTTRTLLRRFPGDGPPGKTDRPAMVWDVHLMPDGQLRRGADPRRAGHWEAGEPATLAKLQKRRLLAADGRPAFADFEGTIQDVVESATGRYLAVRSSAQRPGVFDRNAATVLRVWDTTSGSALEHVQPPRDQQLGAFSPDGRVLVTTGPDGIVHGWELATGRERYRFQGHRPGGVRALVLTSDQRFLFSGGDDTQVLQWDLTGRTLAGVWQPARHNSLRQLVLWGQLESTDAIAANRAIWDLAADSATVAFLHILLKPATAPSAAEVAPLIAKLGSDLFAERQQAQAALAQHGEPVVPALRTALAGSPALEQARRLQKLIQDLAPACLTGDRLRAVRAIEALEHLSTPAARELLQALARGAPGTAATAAAADALQRWPSGGAETRGR